MGVSLCASACAEGHVRVAVGQMSFWLTLLEAGLWRCVVFTVAIALERIDPVQGAKDSAEESHDSAMASPSPHLQ